MIKYNLISAGTMSDLVDTLNFMNSERRKKAIEENRQIYSDVRIASNIVYTFDEIGYYKVLVQEEEIA
jgi:hypothetical protein